VKTLEYGIGYIGLTKDITMSRGGSRNLEHRG